MTQRRTFEVNSPAKKAIMPCFAEPENGNLTDKNIAHGKKGLPLLFVDTHASFTQYSQLNKTAPYGDYNLDWTPGGLTKRRRLELRNIRDSNFWEEIMLQGKRAASTGVTMM